MRREWKLVVAVLVVGGVAGILTAVAFAQASISIDSARAQVTYDRGDDDDERTSAITSGPMGAGYDIRIQADVSETTWRATRWSTSGVSHCIDHDNQSAGNNRVVVLNYYFQKAALLRESPRFPVPSSVGNNEHVFPPPPGGSSVLTLQLFNTGDCTGSPLATTPVNLATDPLTPPNPPLVAGCQGMQVAVVLDESGSIATAGATQDVKDATKALGQGLVGTGATMAVFKFSTVASSSSISPYKTVTQSFVDGELTTYLNNYDPEGYTNWDSGLRKALITDRPDLVIFMTDGNPNRYGDASDNEGISEGYYTPMSPAAGVANQIKQTSHMFVIGVGDGVTDSLSALRIQAVSGIKSFPTYPISTADYTLVTDFEELEEALRNIASNLCNVTVTVKKETDESGPWISKSGWPFTGRVELAAPASPFAYQWYEPNRVTSVNTGSATQPGTTNTAGILRFVWRPTAANALSNITISETPVNASYTPVSVTCTSGGSTIYASDVPAIAESFTLPGLKVRDDVLCVVRNRLKRSTVKVVKNWVGPPSSATIFVDATGAAPYDASTTPADMSGDNASFDYPLSTSVRVGETVVPSGYSATIQCGQSPEQAYAGGPFAVTSPAVDKGIVTCTITNTQLRSHVAVVKRWVGATGSATIFVDPNGLLPYDAFAVAGPSGTSATFTYPISTPTAVGETVPSGYSAKVKCGETAEQPYTGGPFPVTSPDTGGATLTCTITNTQLLSTVKVVKNWVGAAASATIFVDANGSAPYDASLVATADGHNTSFVYPVSTGVFVGEEIVPPGYSATIKCGLGQPQPYLGVPFPVTSPAVAGETITCTITNTQLLSTVKVVKNWFGAAASATIFVDANGSAPYDASLVATADGHNTSFMYPVSTNVFVGEEIVPPGYSATIKCGLAQPQPYLGVPFPVTSPADAGETITCTISNALLPPPESTVRVIKEWVGAQGSTTIFVDADGSVPYDASAVAGPSGTTASFDYVTGTPVTVGETVLPAGYDATIDCGGGPQPYPGGPFNVFAPATAGDTLTCLITNRELLSNVRVIKDWVGAQGSTTIFVDADGVAPYDASAVAGPSGTTASFDYRTGTPVTVGETVLPAGYDATIDCGGGPQPYTGGPFNVTAPVVHGDTLTCLITNREMFSNVRVVKTWDGTPASTTIFVDADGVAPYDASTVATASGQSAVFTYPVDTPVTVGEDAVPPGYRAEIHCGLTREAPQPYTGGAFPVTSPDSDGETVTCTITNIQLRSTVQVVKEWAGGASTATLFVDADGAAPYDASTVSTSGGEGASFTYPLSTPVTVGETVVPSGFTATIDCGGGPQVYAGGPFAVTSPAADKGVLTCTIINTPQTTVRVEKQWAGRPASATIFVDGAGQSPYDVSTVAEADGQSASFDYPPSTQVTLGEIAVPPGYVAFIDCGTGPKDLRRYTGGPITVTSPSTPDGVVTCTVANAKRLTPGRVLITKKANRRVIRGSGQVRFTITVRNTGPVVALGVRVCDRLPKGLQLVRAPGARRMNGSLCWTVPRLAVRGKKSYQVVTRVVGLGAARRLVLVNIAQVGGVNTPNCPRVETLTRRLRLGCNARARVTVLQRVEVRPAIVSFTG